MYKIQTNNQKEKTQNSAQYICDKQSKERKQTLMETSDWKEKEHLLRESLKLKSIRRREEILCKMY